MSVHVGWPPAFEFEHVGGGVPARPRIFTVGMEQESLPPAPSSTEPGPLQVVAFGHVIKPSTKDDMSPGSRRLCR
jgi:hypothetical protein